MSDTETTPPAHGDSHAADPGGHAHEPSGESLGPVDLEAWGYAVAGCLIGLIVAAALFVARGV